MANEQMREQWAKHGGPAWVEHHEIFDSVYAPFNEAIVAALELVAGRVMLDVGCGAGSLSRTIVERGGRAIGADISEPMIVAARALVPEATFHVADAQTAALGDLNPDGFDAVVSRFGVMFFDDPVEAFANIRSATKPGGRLVFVCWRSLRENPTFSVGVDRLADRLPQPPAPAAPGAPGPGAFADAGVVRIVLDEAGWSGVTVQPFDPLCSYGRNGSDGVEERMAMILSNMQGRLAAEQLRPVLGEDGWRALLDEVRSDVRAAKVDGVVALPCRTWIVSAVNG